MDTVHCPRTGSTSDRKRKAKQLKLQKIRETSHFSILTILSVIISFTDERRKTGIFCSLAPLLKNFISAHYAAIFRVSQSRISGRSRRSKPFPRLEPGINQTNLFETFKHLVSQNFVITNFYHVGHSFFA